MFIYMSSAIVNETVIDNGPEIYLIEIIIIIIYFYLKIDIILFEIYFITIYLFIQIISYTNNYTVLISLIIYFHAGHYDFVFPEFTNFKKC